MGIGSGTDPPFILKELNTVECEGLACETNNYSATHNNYDTLP